MDAGRTSALLLAICAAGEALPVEARFRPAAGMQAKG
jgi:hypothetical protein